MHQAEHDIDLSKGLFTAADSLFSPYQNGTYIFHSAAFSRWNLGSTTAFQRVAPEKMTGSCHLL